MGEVEEEESDKEGKQEPERDKRYGDDNAREDREREREI